MTTPTTPVTLIRIATELHNAALARQADNEGKARVCARRAAGWAITEYRRLLGFDPQGITAYSHLRWAANDPDLDLRLRQAAENLIERIDYDHSLPSGADAIAEARLLIAHYLPDALSNPLLE